MLSGRVWSRCCANIAISVMPEAVLVSMSLRRVVDALLYVVKTGCQWRQLPTNFPPWKAVHEQFRRWRDAGLWERVGKALREEGRRAAGRNATPTVAIIDSQSAKTTGKGGRAATTRARKSKAASATSRSTRKAIC